MVVWNRIPELGAVWNHTAIIGKAVLAWVVCNSVVWGRLGPGHGEQHQQHQGPHDLALDTKFVLCHN